MAENAANFTFTSQNRPSIFEIIAQQSLDETLHPALQRIALFLATNSPKKFQWLNKYYDETFLVINGVLQYHFLKQYDATFAENFYGLKRVLNTDNNDKLSNYYRFLSLIGCVLLPYVKRKIDERISFYQLEEADGCLRNNFDGNLKKLAIRSRSTLELIYGTLKIYNFIKYMSGRTDQQLPLLKLLELKLIYSEPNIEDENFWSSILKGDFQFSKLTLLRNSVGGILTIMAFFLQFLQSWNTHKANYSFTALPNVEPPKLDNKASNYRNKCPICLQNWKIPTVLPISGYIFCFPCIVRFLRENQHCPITNLPAKPLDVIRLYDNE